MSEQRRLRVGAIGCGQFMRQQHVASIATSPSLVLQHLADRDSRQLETVAQRWLPVRSGTRWEDVVADPDVDAVVVGVVPSYHPEIVRAALEHGKAVYVEKPLAPTPEQCLELDRLARQRGIPLAVGFNRRFAPATELLGRAFRSRATPVLVSYRISDDDRIRPPAQAWKKEDRLLLEAVHIFDLLAYLVGSEPVRLTATEARHNDTMVLVEFADRSQATILSSSHGSLAQPKEHLEAVLDGGAVEMDDFVECRSYGLPELPAVARFAGRAYDGCDNRHVEDFARRGLAAIVDLRRRYADAMTRSGVLADASSAAAWQRAQEALGDPPPPQINYASDKGWGRALEHFCRAVLDGCPPQNAGAADGNRATACAVAARRSIQTGQPVALDPQSWLAPR